MASTSVKLSRRAAASTSLKAHIQIARFDHWVKNVFVLPGIVVAAALEPSAFGGEMIVRVVVGLLATGLIASSNYVINEVLDAPFDRQHPIKRHRPAACGLVCIPMAYAQWIALMLAGLTIASFVSKPFAATMLVLWIMGCIYNIQPLRSKDAPYLDVLSESVNNPLRMLAGWFIVTNKIIPPASLLLSYWMVGCYFMALKRYAEYRDITTLADAVVAASYRKSFAFYNQERLLSSVMFYGSAAMLFFGAFIMRYRLELIISVPFVALVMAVYLHLAFKPDSVVQRPEGLYREPMLMVSVVACALVMIAMMLVNIPVLQTIFSPTAPTAASVSVHSGR